MPHTTSKHVPFRHPISDRLDIYHIYALLSEVAFWCLLILAFIQRSIFHPKADTSPHCASSSFAGQPCACNLMVFTPCPPLAPPLSGAMLHAGRTLNVRCPAFLARTDRSLLHLHIFDVPMCSTIFINLTIYLENNDKR